MVAKRKVLTFPVTNEQELVEYFAKHFGGRILYHEDRGLFLVWDGKRYRPLESQAYRLARRVIRKLDALVRVAEKYQYKGNFDLKDSRGNVVELEEMRDFVKKLKRFGTAKKIIENSKYENRILKSGDVFDQYHDVLNAENGIISLRDGQLYPHAMEALCTKICATAYDPNATCPLWERVIRDVTCGYEELAWYIQKLLGYAITGFTDQQIIVFFYGLGENGKSLVLSTVQKVLGSYALSTPTSTLLRRSANVIPNDVARLADARLVIGQELNSRDRLNESLTKQLTGQDVVTARYLFQEYFEFLPTFKLIIAANNLPTIEGADDGISRRIRIVPFMARFSGEKRDNGLAKKLEGEFPGILNWLVKGAMAYFNEGLKEPEIVTNASRDYLDDENQVRRFMEEKFTRVKGERVSLRVAYDEYSDWANVNLLDPIGKIDFGRRLKELGYEQNPGGSPRSWRDLGFRTNT